MCNGTFTEGNDMDINKAKEIGYKYRRNVIAFITNGNLLGNKTGNLFETQEAIDVLNGKIRKGPDSK